MKERFNILLIFAYLLIVACLGQFGRPQVSTAHSVQNNISPTSSETNCNSSGEQKSNHRLDLLAEELTENEESTYLSSNQILTPDPSKGHGGTFANSLAISPPSTKSTTEKSRLFLLHCSLKIATLS